MLNQLPCGTPIEHQGTETKDNGGALFMVCELAYAEEYAHL